MTGHKRRPALLAAPPGTNVFVFYLFGEERREKLLTTIMGARESKGRPYMGHETND